MAATCAACLRDIADGERFVLSGTEVFHRRRACVARIVESVGTKGKLELLDLRAELEYARADLRNARTDLAVVKDKLDRAERAVASAKKLVLEEQLRCQREERRSTDAELALRTVTQSRRTLTDELADARAEISRLQSAALKRATDDLPTPVEKDTRDPTEIRFSLLEIDPT